MASAFQAALCAIVALSIWSAIGYPLAKRLFDAPACIALAPILGWAVHSVLALPIFFVVPFSRLSVTLVTLAALGLSVALARLDGLFAERSASPEGTAPSFTSKPFAVGLPILAVLAALALAVTVAAAILPKHIGTAAVLSDQIFDHAKVAIINDMARHGLPPGNPFFANDGGSGRLAYYYLWYFSAAELVKVLGVTAWDADAGMTFFSAFTSLLIMMTLAVKLSGRRNAAFWVVLFALSSSWRPVLERVFTVEVMEAVIPAPGGYGGWLFQSSWVPQHLVSTSCVLLSLGLMHTLSRRRNTLLTVILALTIAAGFEASTWVGGVSFALVCLAAVPLLAWRVKGKHRLTFLLSLSVAALLTVIVAFPFLRDQMAAAAHRHAGMPIGLQEFAVLGTRIAPMLRTILDPWAFWLVLLPIELAAVYVACALLLVQRRAAQSATAQAPGTLSLTFAATAMIALLVSWLLMSRLAENNDLSWRAALLASSCMIPFAAVGINVFWDRRQWFALTAVALVFALGWPETWRQINENWTGNRDTASSAFVDQKALWQTLKKLSSEDERVANNPDALKHMTPWPVNIGWSLLSPRRSCYAGWELTQVYTSIPHAQLWAIDEQFKRVFKGDAEPGDLHALARTYDCSLAVITPEDGAWLHDPFRDSGEYVLANENPEHWRIYRRADAGLEKGSQ